MKRAPARADDHPKATAAPQIQSGFILNADTLAVQAKRRPQPLGSTALPVPKSSTVHAAKHDIFRQSLRMHKPIL
jgi:hypothetical protein